MSKVVFRRGIGFEDVEVRLFGASPSLAAELEHVLLANGAEPRGGCFILPVHCLRACASEIGVILLRHDAETEYDRATLQILETHLEEVESRKAAVSSKSLNESQVKDLLKGSRFVRKLTKRQVANLGRLLALKHGANFSVPGAGKTATTLALYQVLFGRGEVDRLLVVAPKNAFVAWDDEVGISFASPPPVVRRLSGGREGVEAALDEDPEVCVITYQLLANVHKLVREWASRHKTHVVLDESHRIKSGVSGVIGGAALTLSSIAVRRDILSGTPLPQSAEDLRSQLQFLWPGQRIMPEHRISVEAPLVEIEDIQQRVTPLYVRTTKEQLALPPLTVTPIRVELGPLQREIYELLRSEAHRKAAGLPVQDRTFLRMLGRHVVRLLEAASNPLLLTQSPLLDEEDDPNQAHPQQLRAFELLREFSKREKPAKLMAAVERSKKFLSRNPEGKVLLWVSFVQNIRTLEKLLSEFSPVVLYGAVGTGDEEDPDTREGRIKEFHENPKCRVMIANPAACGEAISLHKACHYAIYVDRTFNAAHYLQSIDRIHRLGLSSDQVTSIEVLEAAFTIDARVGFRLKTKIASMSTILNDPGLMALAYDPEDVTEEYPAGLELADVEEVINHLLHGEERE